MGGTEPGKESSNLTHRRCRLELLRCIMHWFITIFVIQVLKLDSPRKGEIPEGRKVSRLDGVLGLVARPQYSTRHSEGRSIVALEQLGDRVDISVPKICNQLQFRFVMHSLCSAEGKGHASLGDWLMPVSWQQQSSVGEESH